YYGTQWTGAATGARTSTSTQATGLTGFGDLAVAELKNYTLNVNVVGSGSVAKNPNQPTYSHGTVVSLSATASVGYHFVGWSGDTTGTASPISVTMTSNKNITATFAINTYTLGIT